jgi:hypothetical protein
MPRYMMLMHPAAFPAAGEAPRADLVAAMLKYNEELAQAGVLLSADGLEQPEKGSRVRFEGGRPRVTDGPFTEAKELIGGYWIIQASSQEEAVQWTSRCPAADGDMIEVRPIQQYPEDPA